MPARPRRRMNRRRIARKKLLEPIWTITLFADLTVRPGGGASDALGSEASDDATVRRFRSQKVASLLAYLAFHRGQAASREFLCEMLWPDEDPDIARNRLRVTLASLRRQLEPPPCVFGTVIEVTGNGQIRMRAEAVATDVAHFETARKRGDATGAAAWYRGPLLPALYDEWIDRERERFAALFDGLATLPAASGTAFSDPPHAATVPPAEVVTPPQKPAAATPPKRLVTELPRYLTRFIGRSDELTRLRALCADPDVRLITLTGGGGGGKTRLATETVKNDPNLLAFVPLADLFDAHRLGDVLRQALRLPPVVGGDVTAQIAAFLNETPGPVLIALDNAEQIAQGTALFVEDLLARTPDLTILVTSRRRLDIAGEREVAVAPLALPPPGETPEQVAAAPSVRLFLDRVQATRPDYQVTPRSAAPLATLCRLLDGIPLALELAAARATVLTPEQMCELLAVSGQDAFAAPVTLGGKENRSRSLGAVIEWSYALLPPELRSFFLALSVFRGGWDEAAATAITGEPNALDFLGRLRGHSLVTADGGARFRMLETLRIWASERLDREASGGDMARTVRDRHAAFFLSAGEKALAQSSGASEVDLLDHLERDEANLRAAFDHVLLKNDANNALRFCQMFSALGSSRGSATDTLRLLEKALAVPGPSDAGLRARALSSSGLLLLWTQGPEAARPSLEAALTFAREADDQPLVAKALRCLGDIALSEQQYHQALPFFNEALEIQRKLGDDYGIAQTQNSLGMLARFHEQDLEKAARLTEEAIRFFRQIGDVRMLSIVVCNLGEILLEQGDINGAEAQMRETVALAEALGADWERLLGLFSLAGIARRKNDDPARRALLREALPLALRLGDLPTLADLLTEQAALALGDRDPRRAVTLLAYGVALREQARAAPHQPLEQAFFDATLAAARSALPARSFDALWKKSMATTVTPPSAVALALSDSTPVATSA